MALLSLQDVSMGFGRPLLLEQVNLQIERGERVCLLGRNGAGKSTLLKLINGDLLPDSGEVVRQKGMYTAYLSQEIPGELRGTVSDVVSDGLKVSDRYQSIQNRDQGWKKQHQVEKVISQMQLDGNTEFNTLSSGLKRRVLLARGLVCDPDILLLDEPTNHLDVDSIGWLEEFLLRYGGTILFVTHDRTFLKKLATRIIELDRGNLANWACDYETFLVRKQAVFDAEERQHAVFDKKLAQEEIWIRQGIKARRTRNEGRVRALEDMRRARQERRQVMGTVRMQAQEADRSGALVIKVEDATYSYNAKPIIRGFSAAIMRGDKIGIIGPNGSGKTTLLRLLLGELIPQQGNVRHGTRLNITYFDQLRAQLKEDASVFDNIGDGNDFITFNGKPRHVISYLQDFLFLPDRARIPVNALSGGERNRLLLARLFSRPSNVLVMDEPTNDLDLETLELLEELLLDYQGTLLLVSHDRTFLNNVVTSTLVFEGEGKVNEYIGGYDDWQRQSEGKKKNTLEKTSSKTESFRKQCERPRKLSFKEQRELETLPQRIEILETEQQQLYQVMGDPLFYQKGKDEIANIKARVSSLECELAEAYQRWETLEKF
ncbi:MAG: ATP-binding cassette domain-containing protein [Candidatus Jettenia sp.]|uniref:ATP-binding protein Uup n=1 Tax=Candidatus Jettenia caeni TaxID=247490 RepID=I3IKL2_9BACT|nr:ATP-binding cassette domain-containing protein [Candidatus Jettenia sp. AMX1]MBC6929420.1 ATP-binding cassette domain-containing protein [Candidatus Jettenia sp.]NUN22258.1 ATP-binding cassette domain-containing protein [Candidatus Jettenia caeni]KAA0247574.1 MAG: ATP-binding cassette domain-containing protein [Candidatus Jettenia sp. AMX1]MCE7880821.1 ATP-binding cassette domain-containing protein [Candidatus Jettenia sp. AMX1]MCQ3927605.1 ATP-binding cassette domain-containing protein [Ca